MFVARDLALIIATDHNSACLEYILNTSEITIFAFNGSWILTPEGESGLYCELLRADPF